MDNYSRFKERVYGIIKIFCIAIAVIGLSFFTYYKYMQSKIHIQEPEGFSVEIESDNLTLIGEKWLEAYTEQFKQKYLQRSERIVGYSIEDIEVLEDNVIRIDFSVVHRHANEESALLWEGTINKNEIQCQWVLWFDKKTTAKGTIAYTVTKLQRPAGYDLEKYQTSGQKEKDEYEKEHSGEIPYAKQQYTYKIQKGVCYVSYDEGSTWKEVPVPLKTLAEVGDGNSYYNQLQLGSYFIAPEKTAFIYGGTRENGLMITYTEDMGTTWKTAEISHRLDSTRVKFCSFPTVKAGYAIATGGRTMSQEMQVIYKTSDGGATWQEVGQGPSTWLLQYAGFVDEKVGFMSYPKIEGAETNFYRTEDGGKTFKPIILPVVREEWLGMTLEPFIQPETPYLENGQMFLLVGQGSQGDFKGGNVIAKYKSEDKGETWHFVELVEPPSQEIG